MLRPALASVGIGAAALLSWMAMATDPATHDVTVPTVVGQSVTIEWTGTIPAGASGAATNSCGLTPVTAAQEDHHTINLAVPEGTYDDVAVTAVFTMEWDDGGQDLVLTVINEGEELGSSDGGEPVESVTETNPTAGAIEWIGCPFAADSDTPVRGKLVMTAAAIGGTAEPPDAGLGNAAGLPPRFHNYAPDYPAQGFGMFGGEATLDANWTTDSLFYLGFLETLRLRLDDTTSPAIQTWELMETVASNRATSDPILVADRQTGRVFSMQLLLGPGTSAMDYSDDDGATWTPGMAGSVLRSGADHQSLDVGPYPADTSIPHPSYPNAVYYCSHDVAVAYCSRSDDGGVTFGPSVPIYSQGNCNGLHGHVKIASDGTVYVPNSNCTPIGGGAGILSDRVAVAVSEDAGLTWTLRFVGEATSSGSSDPSMASASDGTMYLSYVDAERQPHMVKTTDKGVTWTGDVDLGALTGITAGIFPAVVAGDPDRAAVTFFGSTSPITTNPEDGAGYPAPWHLYVATTYDGGATYHVSNLTPGDPIQRGPICGGNYCRNLLDFYDASIDPQGRILVGYEDGCVGGCVAGGISQYSDQAVLARQSGGRTLFAANDPVEPKRAGAPRISGHRRADFAYLEWPEPDTGGAPITEYRIYRAAGSAPLTLLRSTGTMRKAADFGLDPATTYRYRVTAVNALGESAQGNELALAQDDNAPTPEQICSLPGWKMATDVTGEAEATPLTRDIAEMYVAEPEDMPGMLVISERIAQAAAPTQGGAYFFVYFDIAGQPDRTWRARLSADGTPVEYWDGTVVPTDDQMDWQRVYTAAGTLAAGSGITADGFVRFVFDKAALGIENKGADLLAINGRSFPGPRGSNVLTEEAGYFDYKVRGNDFCALGGIDPPPAIGPGSGPVVPVPEVAGDNGRFGGALGLGLLFAFMTLVALRRRAR